MKAIIDTNCLVASIPPKNPEYWLYKAFRNKAFDGLLEMKFYLSMKKY
jgi:uncharacterized protein